MKKIFAIAAVAALVLTGCVTNDEALTVNNGQNEVSFRSYVGTTTKGYLPVGAENFGVFAYYLAETGAWQTNFGTAASFMDDVEVAYNSADIIWKPTSTYYWPKTDYGKLSFIAYSPKADATAVVDLTGGSPTLTLSAVAVGSDLLYSDVSADKNYTNAVIYNNGTTDSSVKGAPIAFHHAGAAVVFKAKTAADYSTGAGNVTININSIELKSLEALDKVTITYNNTTKTAPNAVATDIAFTNAAGADQVVYTGPSADLTNTAIELVQWGVAPQTGVAVAEVKYRVLHANCPTADYEVTTQLDLSADTWALNKKFTYTLIASMDQLYFSPSVEDWDVTGTSADKDI